MAHDEPFLAPSPFHGFVEGLVGRDQLLEEVQAKDRIMRAIYHWKIVSVQALVPLLGHHFITIVNALDELLAAGHVRKVGRIRMGKNIGMRSTYYVAGKTPYKKLPFLHRFPSGFLIDPDSTGALLPRANLELTSGKLVPRHYVYSSEVASWLAGALEDGFSIFPESILRTVFGWFWGKEEGRMTMFKTPVPDAWFCSPPVSFRLEVELSPMSRTRRVERYQSIPAGELVCVCTVWNDGLFAQNFSYEEEFPNVVCIKFGDKEGVQILSRRLEEARGEAGQNNMLTELRACYSRDYFPMIFNGNP